MLLFQFILPQGVPDRAPGAVDFLADSALFGVILPPLQVCTQYPVKINQRLTLCSLAS
jgi:hypothetical protein